MRNTARWRWCGILAAVLSVVLILSSSFTSPIIKALSGWGVVKADVIDPDPVDPDKVDPEEMIPFHTVVYFAQLEKDRPFYFGANVWEEAQAAIARGEVETVLEYIIGTDDYLGNLWYRMMYDPALCAAICLYLDQNGVSGVVPILNREVDLEVGARADHAHMEFLKDPEYWEWCFTRAKNILLSEDAEIWIEELGDYESAMYMVEDGLGLGIPLVYVGVTDGEDGHCIVFSVRTEKDGPFVEVRLRLECGYQPIDVPGWDPPSTTPTPSPSPTPSDTPTPTPSDTPTPTPSTTPKDPSVDPQNRVNPDSTDPSEQNAASDFYSDDRINNDSDTTETPEPTSPSSYVSPDPPVATPTTAPSPTPIPTPVPTTPPTPTTAPSPTPVTGNSQSSNWAPVDDVANNNPATPEPNLGTDVNYGDIEAPE